MIHHLSVSAADPKSAAEFFADVMNGVVVDFQPNPGSYMVFKADGRRDMGDVDRAAGEA